MSIQTVSAVLMMSVVLPACHQMKDTPRADRVVHAWITTPDQKKLLVHDSLPLTQTSRPDSGLLLLIDTAQKFQVVEGFGYTLTGGSAYLINNMRDSLEDALLLGLFGQEGDALRISYLRISLGASDLDSAVFSYSDLAPGQTDSALNHFTLGPDTVHLIPLLKRIKSINPGITIMASPWSPPPWMKSNNSSIGGSLLPQYRDVYARYFVRYIREMQTHGITIDAITIQNEPHHGGNNPSMLMTAEEQTVFIKDYLGPAFKAAGIRTQIIIWDHNCDTPEFPIAVLNDSAARQFIHGSAFHLYAGDESALSQVQRVHPDKALYFTEQWTGSKGTFDGDFQWHIRHVIIGTMRNWSRIALEWNLASDPKQSIHTPGGCTECKGALTIDGDAVQKNVSYYIIAHASRFVPPGSVRIASSLPDELPNVSFITPSGQIVLIVLNDSNKNVSFSVDASNVKFSASIEPGTVGTYVW